MSQRTASRLAWALGAISVIAILAGVALEIISPAHQLPPEYRSSAADVFDDLSILGLPLIGTLVASRRSGILLGWVFLLAGLGLGLSNFGSSYTAYALIVQDGSLPGGHAAGWLANWTWTLGIGALPFLLLLFPTGRLVSRRWRAVGWIALVCTGVLVITAAVMASLAWSRPLVGPETSDFAPAAQPLVPFLIGAILAINGLSLVAFVSTALRFKKARGEERQQLKWFVTAAAIFVTLLVINLFITNIVVAIGFSLAQIGLFVAVGIAILKYRLYDIDVVINKAVVFGALAAFFTAVYVAIVVGIGALVGSRANRFLTVAAAVLIAVAFQPVRERAKHLANRLVYGRRATPYEVLSQFSERMTGGYATEDLPSRMAQILGDGTGATGAVVWLEVGAELRPAATWPADASALEPIPVRGNDVPAPPHAAAFFPVRHHGELLGALSIDKPANEPLTPAEEKLVSDLASQAGLVMRNVGLIEELRASRQRLVKAQDEERRRLERNIHDGAQQQLVALSVKLTLARAMARKDAERADAMLAELQAEAQDAMENLRDLARGIYPPLLADHGLVAALDAQARKAAVPVEIETDGISRYPQEAEAAVYFCTLEALQNVAKYAGAAHAAVHLREENGALVFEVTDDGVGFDPAARGYGTGLQGMADRLAALGGELVVRSAPGAGTTVTGRLPAHRVAQAT
ncbi:MAG TPA: GAF domain-containing sensor histidine kinase [Actinomycetota bacterium]